MKKLTVSSILLALLLPTYSFAFDLSGIIKVVSNIYGVNLDIKNLQNLSLDNLTALKDGLTGMHSYGSTYYDANQFNWGNGTSDWESIVTLTRIQNGTGDVARTIGELANQFPMSNDNVSNNDVENEYYRVQAQTNLAARASSQVAFKQLNDAASTMSELHQLIDQTKDNKSAVDLNNRLASEQAAINIQQAKLLAILVEQAAINNQERANVAKENADFFDAR